MFKKIFKIAHLGVEVGKHKTLYRVIDFVADKLNKLNEKLYPFRRWLAKNAYVPLRKRYRKIKSGLKTLVSKFGDGLNSLYKITLGPIFGALDFVLRPVGQALHFLTVKPVVAVAKFLKRQTYDRIDRALDKAYTGLQNQQRHIVENTFDDLKEELRGQLKAAWKLALQNGQTASQQLAARQTEAKVQPEVRVQPEASTNQATKSVVNVDASKQPPKRWTEVDLETAFNNNFDSVFDDGLHLKYEQNRTIFSKGNPIYYNQVVIEVSSSLKDTFAKNYVDLDDALRKSASEFLQKRHHSTKNWDPHVCIRAI